jgi:hypothetical protein
MMLPWEKDKHSSARHTCEDSEGAGEWESERGGVSRTARLTWVPLHASGELSKRRRDTADITLICMQHDHKNWQERDGRAGGSAGAAPSSNLQTRVGFPAGITRRP